MIDFFDIKTREEYLDCVSELLTLGYRLHHSAYMAGYIPRGISCRVAPYKGKFGEGVILCYPSYDSTRYFVGDYYILEDER